MEDVKKSADIVNKELSKMLSALDNKLITLPEGYSDLIKESRLDISKALRSLKNGDQNGLQQIVKKYASFNR
jgi:hypothetical protein